MENSNQQDLVYKSKNLIAERKRRSKLNERLYALRSLVPKITKMSKATILDDAFNYIQQLQKQVKELQDELMRMPDEEEEKQGNEASFYDMAEEVKCEFEVVVTPVDANKLTIKIICKNKKSGFSKLMEAISSLNLEVTSINVTTFKGVALNTICVEGKDLGMFEGDRVREWLLKTIKE